MFVLSQLGTHSSPIHCKPAVQRQAGAQPPVRLSASQVAQRPRLGLAAIAEPPAMAQNDKNGKVSPDDLNASIAYSQEWKALEDHVAEIEKTHLRELLGDPQRSEHLFHEHNGILCDLSRQRVTDKTLELWVKLAEKAHLKEKIEHMFDGAHLNVTEDRSVLHVALRAPRDYPINAEGKNVVPEVWEVLDKIKDFSDKVRKGEWLGATGEELTDVVAIGIGGSFLGPLFVHTALRTDQDASGYAYGRNLRFLANVDPVDVARALNGLRPETTLAVVVSKTFTTAETMLNARTVRTWLTSALGDDAVSKHMVAVSTNRRLVKEFGINPDNAFGFWDWVGGRYSVCSAVGMLPLALQYGFSVMQQFLAGAHDVDVHFRETPFEKNIPVLLGLASVWNVSFLGYPARAILPYTQALSKLAPHIQQVSMESNGKGVGIDGQRLPYEAGEIDFGEPGTNGQHSFYQLIHQGRVVPCDFIGVVKSQQSVYLKIISVVKPKQSVYLKGEVVSNHNEPMCTLFAQADALARGKSAIELRTEGEVVSNHDELMCNFFAQADALATGKSAIELRTESVPDHLIPHKTFTGNRPSLSIMMPELSAYTVGQLLALYENRIAVQGFIWGINSFDQWGVELGKVLASKVRQAVHACRTQARSVEPMDAFNPSTQRLLNRYLEGKAQLLYPEPENVFPCDIIDAEACRPPTSYH